MGRLKYTEAERARALALLAEHGLGETVRLLAAEGRPIAKSTVRDWALAAGQRTDGDENARSRTMAATAAATEARRRRAAEALDEMVPLLAEIALSAAETELAVHRAMGRLRHNAYPDDPAEDALAALEATAPGSAYADRVERAKDRVAVAAFGPKLSEIVGSRTRAIHDLVILRGGEVEGGTGLRPADLLEQAKERRLHLAGGTATG